MLSSSVTCTKFVMYAFIMHIVHFHTLCSVKVPPRWLSRRSRVRASQSSVSHVDCTLRAPHFCVVAARIVLCSPRDWSRPQSPWRPSCGLPVLSGRLPTLPLHHTLGSPAFPVCSIWPWPIRKVVLELLFYCSVMKESERELGAHTLVSQWIRWWRQISGYDGYAVDVMISEGAF